MNEQKDKYIQEQRNKIRQKEYSKALKDNKTFKQEPVKFERPQEGKIDKRIGGMDTFHVEKGEEKNTYRITTKREYTFAYQIRAKNEEDAMIRTLTFVSKDGSGQYLQGPMLLGKPLIREWIDKIEKLQEVTMAKKKTLGEKIQKELDKLAALHEKEEVIIDRIGFFIEAEEENNEEAGYGGTNSD